MNSFQSKPDRSPLSRIHMGMPTCSKLIYLTSLNDKKYFFNDLIWAADLKTFYRITKTDGLPSKIITSFEEKKIQMFKSRGTDSIFGLYLEVDEPLESFGKIANGHFFYTPSKGGLGETHWKELSELIENWKDKQINNVYLIAN